MLFWGDSAAGAPVGAASDVFACADAFRGTNAAVDAAMGVLGVRSL